MGLYWHTAPVCTVDVDTQGYHPGEGDGSTCPGILPGMTVHAYDPDPRTVVDEGDPEVEGDETYAVPTTCLVGMATDESGRDGWTGLTLQEAKDHFEDKVGREPLDSEVY